MIEEIGYLGINSIMNLGTRSDVVLFFDVIKAYPVFDNPEIDFSLVTDRLYKRYVRFEDLDKTHELMKFIGESFKALPPSCVEWSPVQTIENGRTNLDNSKSTLYEVFQDYFECFDELVASAKYFYEDDGSYRPIKIARTTTPYYVYFKRIPLEYYDNLNEKPYWCWGIEELNELYETKLKNLKTS